MKTIDPKQAILAEKHVVNAMVELDMARVAFEQSANGRGEAFARARVSDLRLHLSTFKSRATEPDAKTTEANRQALRPMLQKALDGPQWDR